MPRKASGQPQYKRKMVYDPVTNTWRSQTTDRVLTPAQYEARCENARKAAAAQKELHAYLKSEEYQQEEAEMMKRLEERTKRPPRPLPGWQPGWHIYAGRVRRS
jgi:hypothetical protein